jgi:hypothetical protein
MDDRILVVSRRHRQKRLNAGLPTCNLFDIRLNPFALLGRLQREAISQTDEAP